MPRHGVPCSRPAVEVLTPTSSRRGGVACAQADRQVQEEIAKLKEKIERIDIETDGATLIRTTG